MLDRLERRARLGHALLHRFGCLLLISEDSSGRSQWRRIGQPVERGATVGSGREGDSECEKKGHLKMRSGNGCAPRAEVWCV